MPRKKSKDFDFYKSLKSPIPPHLTKKEQEEWEKELAWQEVEMLRRKDAGMYKKTKRKSSSRLGKLWASIRSKR